MRKLAFFGAVLAMLGTAGTVRAQTATGQITGTVKDATGAVVPGATVTVVSELTGSRREAVTGREGNYSIPLLPVSTYSVTASLQGFRAAKRTGIRLFVDQVARVLADLAAPIARGVRQPVAGEVEREQPVPRERLEQRSPCGGTRVDRRLKNCCNLCHYSSASKL